MTRRTIFPMYDDTCRFLAETFSADFASWLLGESMDIMQESVIYRSIQQERDRSIALNLLREGISIETVARGTGLSIEEVQQLQQQMNENQSQ